MNKKLALACGALVLLTVGGVFVFENSANPRWGSEQIPGWYQALERACQPRFASEECKQAFLGALREQRLWGDVSENLKKGDEAWQRAALTLSLVDNEDQEGEFYILLQEGKPAPFLALSSKRQSLPETLITLNHELVHYGNSKSLIEAIPNRKVMVEGCITTYEEAVLRDESNAYQSEVRFWKEAPDWFKKLLAETRFNSRFTGNRGSSYEEHYAWIEQGLLKDPLFGSKQYVRMGEYPECSMPILERSGQQR